jgi:hypothetical protein
LFVLRFVALIGGLLLVGLLIAFAVTRNKRYLRIAWLGLQILVLLGVGFGLIYVFERVLLL